MGLAAYIIAKNESAHITAAVKSLLCVTEAVLVVDAQSSDDTVELANRAGAVVLDHQFEDFASQRNWAVEQLIRLFDPSWIFALDADERLSEGLINELRELERRDPSFDAFLVPIRIKFAGRTLRFGGMAKKAPPRLFRPSVGRYEKRSVNEYLRAAESTRWSSLKKPILHEDVLSWELYTEKHNRYSSLEAAERWRLRSTDRSTTAWEALRRPYLRRRWVRERLYNPLPAKPLVRFLQMYVLSLGILDGSAGLERAVWASWHEACIDLKYKALRSSDRSGDTEGLP